MATNRKERADAVQGNRGKGRKKGTPNKLTRDVKEMILGALDKAGGVDYLVKQASASPAAFLTLVGKVLPLQVTGKDGGPIQTQQLVPAQMTPEQRREEIQRLLQQNPDLLNATGVDAP